MDEKKINNLINMLIIFIVLFGSLATLSFIILIFNEAFFIKDGIIDAGLSAQLGNAIGGISGSLFALTSALILAVSILSQSKVLLLQKRAIENQTNIDRRNRFETAFYKLVDYHRDNVQNMRLVRGNNEVGDKECFILFVKMYLIIKNLIKDKGQIHDDRILYNLSYILLIYGYRNDAEHIALIIPILTEHLSVDVDVFIQQINHNPPSVNHNGHTYSTSGGINNITGNYYRNMYNCIKMIDEETSLKCEHKEMYAKILRTQLSNSEIIFLVFNALSNVGENWVENNYINKYQMIKNLPKNYVDEHNLKELFQGTNFEFEEL